MNSFVSIRYLVALIFFSFAIPFGVVSYSTPYGSDGAVLLAASKKKKKKRKKRRKKRAEVQSEEPSSDGSLHQAQEGGEDAPYKAILGASFSYESKSSTTTVDGESGDAVPSTYMSLGIRYLFLVDSIAVGPEFTYYTSESGEDESKYTYSGNTIGAMGKFHFADINSDTTVPFAQIGFGLTSSTSKSGEADASNESGTKIKVGGGADFFLDSNVAIEAAFDYVIDSDKTDSDPAQETSKTGFELSAGILILI